MTASFEVQSTRFDGKVRIEVRGLLDAYHGLRLREEVAQRIASGVTEIDIEASEVSFIDSGGLRVLVDTARDLENRGGCLALLEPSETVLQVLEITGLKERFGL